MLKGLEKFPDAEVGVKRHENINHELGHDNVVFELAVQCGAVSESVAMASVQAAEQLSQLRDEMLLTSLKA